MRQSASSRIGILRNVSVVFPLALAPLSYTPAFLPRAAGGENLGGGGKVGIYYWGGGVYNRPT